MTGDRGRESAPHGSAHHWQEDGTMEKAEEMEMLKQLGSVLDDPEPDEVKLHVRGMVEEEIRHMDGDRSRSRRHTHRMRMLLIAAVITAASLGGIALAGGFSDGLGVDAPPGPKIPYVQERIDQIEAELAAQDTSTPEGAAKADSLRDELAEVQKVLASLCEQAGQPEGC